MQLKTPFGGGKTHSLLALYHLARSRDAAAQVPELDRIPDPGPSASACSRANTLIRRAGARSTGRTIRTLWGELAYQLGGWPAYDALLVDGDEGPPPGGERLGRLLADASPALVLLDEVLVYVAKAKAVTVGSTTLDRQVLLFVQHLTEAVNQARQAALIYSLQASVGEAVGEEGLLEQLEKIAGRIDERREPVSGDEVLKVVQRRLFADAGAEDVRREVARQYGALLSEQLAAAAETDADRREAVAAGEALERRIVESYPFHPELLDLMFHRWGSLPSYQRTRGALQFLATVVHALWAGRAEREPQALIGPGDVDLADEGSRDDVPRAGRGDRAVPLGRSRPTSSLPTRAPGASTSDSAATPRGLSVCGSGRESRRRSCCCRSARAQGADRGALEREVIEASLVPGLDRHVLLSALEAMRGEALLYLHHVARPLPLRAATEPQPSDPAGAGASQRATTCSRAYASGSRARSAATGPDRRHVVIWPAAPGPGARRGRRVPRRLPAAGLEPAQRPLADWILQSSGGPRVNRNALCLVEPDAARFDAARAAARAIAGCRGTAQPGRQAPALPRAARRPARAPLSHRGRATHRARPRLRTRPGSHRTRRRRLAAVLLPRAGDDPRRWPRSARTRPRSTRHPRRRQAVSRKGRIARRARPRARVALGARGSAALPQFLDAPKVWTPEALALGIAEGVQQGTFGYVAGASPAEDGSLSVASPTTIRLRETLSAEQIGRR